MQRTESVVGVGTAQYNQVVQKSVLIHFVFSHVGELKILDFNHQNVINSITVSQMPTSEEPRFLVDIESIWGFGGSIECGSVTVESVENVTDDVG